ncbi:MAG: hypothetical protein B7O98_03070 [Zestosphaera tikiterensis]|uniref:Uncharacterized protein n=1 Tax=Zestosphaera tikiterensis TaxID=1973259 RepID=A0A2R7Y7X4_9CREN|nr:MAG: hypothetical protein B7O98_03070 [Zestosphaera tikiterensis]
MGYLHLSSTFRRPQNFMWEALCVLYIYALIDLLEVYLPHTLNIITIKTLEETTYKLSIPALKGEAFSCKKRWMLMIGSFLTFNYAYRSHPSY